MPHETSRTMIDDMICVTRQAGKRALAYWGTLSPAEITHKGEVDLVTQVDRDVEDFLKGALDKAFPNVGFCGEETGDTGGDEGAPRFIVDPIDGTTNFVHAHPYFAVSVAYEVDSQLEIGVVYCPAFDDIYYASRGGGAYRNGVPIQVSGTDSLINSLVGTGFACVRQRRQPDNVPIVSQVIYDVRGIRRGGSAAIDCCYVAEGRQDLFWELNLRPWDVAAGVLIVQEAGGRVTDFEGQHYSGETASFIASNGHVHDAFLQLASVRDTARQLRK